MSDVDVVVIGGGAAGLSAALVLARARRRVVVVDAGAPRNAPAARVHGFITRDGCAPSELLALARKEVAEYGTAITSGTVTDALPNGNAGFWVLLADGRRISTRRLLVTTGLRDELPDVPGLRDRWARDVLHCPYCHGYEVRDRRLAVLGWSPESPKAAQLLRQWAHDVVYFTMTGTLSAADRNALVARAIGIVEGAVTGITVDNDQLSGVEVDGERVIARDAVFVAPRFVPNSDLLARLGCHQDAAGSVDCDRTGRTGVAGVWVAGNVANARAQVITAAGEGSAAAIALNADLVEDDVRGAVREFNLGHIA